jgi:acyl-CoA synthetase (AMP-forming)/AMP-acid ligase II
MKAASIEPPSTKQIEIPHFPSRLSITLFDDATRGSGESTVTILTSGTSGKPKAATHTWTTLARPIRMTQTEETQRWLLSYAPHLYAGLQVILQCMAQGGVLVVDDSRGDIAALVKLMCDHRVGYVSATPSYWRKLFMLADPNELVRVPIVQVTLGGEVADQLILDKLSATFPQARIIHIYATTELGRCFSVTDRLAGFPARFLEQTSPDGVRMKIEEGELLVQSENRMRKYDSAVSDGVSVTQDGWTRTGDLVDRSADRVYFVGRRSDLINVGGNKVAPLEVERVIREVNGVADVRVFPQNSSIAGQLVACEIVPGAGANRDDLRRRVISHCQASLAGHARPRWITMVDQIELSSANKVRRTN